MFIFDEADKFPPGLIDTIKGYLGYYPKIDGVVYRKTIFIFIRLVVVHNKFLNEYTMLLSNSNHVHRY